MNSTSVGCFHAEGHQRQAGNRLPHRGDEPYPHLRPPEQDERRFSVPEVPCFVEHSHTRRPWVVVPDGGQLSVVLSPENQEPPPI